MNLPSKKHHYVPQFLLHNFYDPDAKLFVFDKVKSSSFTSTTGNTGHENNFNTVELGNETINFEEVYEEIDSTGAKLIRKIASFTHTWNLSSIEMEQLAIFVAAQFLRTKMPRKQIEELNNGLKSWIEATPFGKINKDSFLKKLSQEEIKLISLISLGEIEDYKEYILERDLVIIRTKPSDPFYLSDNPVKLYSSKPDKHAGLKVLGTHIYFPISPTMLLCFMCKTAQSNALSNIRYFRSKQLEVPKDLKNIYLAIVEKRITEVTTENVEFYNHLQVKNSSRFIYSIKDDFALARKMILSSPSLKDGSQVLSVGGNHYPDMPDGEIAVLSLTDEKSITVEMESLPSEFKIAIRVPDKNTFNAIISITDNFYGIEIFNDRQLRKGMKNIRIFAIKKEEQIIEFEHTDPGIEQILRFSREEGRKREALRNSKSD